MEYSSTVTIPSTVYPGLSYQLHKPSYGRVLEFDRQNAAFRQKARALNKRSLELSEEVDAQRKDWTRTQEAKRAEAVKNEDNAAVARIDAGFEFERLIDLAQRGPTAEQRKEIAEKLAALPADKETFQIDPAVLQAIRDVREEADALTASEYNPQRLRWGLASIAGLTINGKPATGELLFSDGPTDLVREILAKIDAIASMTPDELRNFGQPSTSSAVEPKAESSTTAIAA